MHIWSQLDNCTAVNVTCVGQWKNPTGPAVAIDRGPHTRVTLKQSGAYQALIVQARGSVDNSHRPRHSHRAGPAYPCDWEAQHCTPIIARSTVTHELITAGQLHRRPGYMCGQCVHLTVTT